MGSACVSVNIKEIEALTKKLKGYALTPAQENNLLKSLGVEIETQISERIESTKRDPEGKTWAELADKTRQYLLKHFPSARPPLWRTGELLDTIESQVSGAVLLTGATKEYAGFLQDGTKRMPARPFIGLSAQDIADLADLIDAWLKEHVAA
ncbi:phage virion morphogenesis protein [Treponema lecithinolyticum]|uniref:phage virion morphogenesis protein n=1 Tax=Treponema lecithinolyticum TaxID=53418 RepID=UPI0028F071C2|nr:phage virion morphogenesis protein [Treponema lecithinolyticum]